MNVKCGLIFVGILMSAAGAQLDDIEHVQETETDVQVRSRREAEEICKYKKGSWTDCDDLTGLESRLDSLKAGQSSPGCSKDRTITRNCRQRQAKSANSQGLCVYERARTANWTDCQHGVRTKSLKLTSSTGTAVCPQQKVISKKCPSSNKKNKKQKKQKKNKGRKERNNKKNADKKNGKPLMEGKDKMERKKPTGRPEDNCEFGAWEEFTPCTKGKKERKRQIIKGASLKFCQRRAVDKEKC